jgi:hypothetical protein
MSVPSRVGCGQFFRGVPCVEFLSMKLKSVATYVDDGSGLRSFEVFIANVRIR